MTGFLGQKFDFTGEDGGWYALIADENMNINMRVTSPVAELPEITYITGGCASVHHAVTSRPRVEPCIMQQCASVPSSDSLQYDIV